MASLKELAFQIAHTLGRPTDYILVERAKQLLLQGRSTLLHREFDKYGVSDIYIQPLIIDLQLVNASEDSSLGGIQSNKTILRSINKIPTPIRYEGYIPFTFVGSIDRLIPFRYVKPYMIPYLSSLKLIGNSIAYSFVNSYIYILNNTKLEKILSEAPYDSIAVDGETDITGLCYIDNMEFPLSSDYLNVLLVEVINILRNTNDIKEKSIDTIRDIN